MSPEIKCPQVYHYNPTSNQFILMTCIRERCGYFSRDAGECGVSAAPGALLGLVGVLARAGSSLEGLGQLAAGELTRLQTAVPPPVSPPSPPTECEQPPAPAPVTEGAAS